MGYAQYMGGSYQEGGKVAVYSRRQLRADIRHMEESTLPAMYDMMHMDNGLNAVWQHLNFCLEADMDEQIPIILAWLLYHGCNSRSEKNA